MIRIFSGARLFPIEFAAFAHSIILGKLPDGNFATFLEHFKTQSQGYRQVIKEQHGALHYNGPSLEDFEALHKELPDFVKDTPYGAIAVPSPFFTDFIVFADKENYNVVLIKTIKTLYGSRGKTACWHIYNGYRRQVLFSLYKEYAHYFLAQPEFEMIFDALTVWKGDLSTIAPFEYSKDISDEKFKDFYEVSLVKAVTFQEIDAIVQNAYILPEIYPDKFRYDMTWIEWKKSFEETFPVTYAHAIGSGEWQSNDSTRFGRLIKQKSNLPLLIEENHKFHQKFHGENPHYAPFEDWWEANADLGLSADYFLTKPIGESRKWVKEHLASFYFLLTNNYDINGWVWSADKL